MKRTLKLFSVLCLTALLFSLSSCQKQEKLILGTWTAKTVSVDELTFDAPTMGDYKCTFNSDNTLSLSLTPNESLYKTICTMFRYIPEGQEYEEMVAQVNAMLTMVAAMKIPYTLSNEKLTITVDGESASFDIRTLKKKELVLSYTGEADSTADVPTSATITFAK